jgi:hypothetical protein
MLAFLFQKTVAKGGKRAAGAEPASTEHPPECSTNSAVASLEVGMSASSLSLGSQPIANILSDGMGFFACVYRALRDAGCDVMDGQRESFGEFPQAPVS